MNRDLEKHRTLKILLAGDADNCRRLEADLSNAGMDVTLSADWLGAEFHSEYTEWELVVVSCANMKEALELCEAIRSLSNAPVIVLLDGADETEMIASLAAGADDWLSQPFTTGELLARIRSVLGRSRLGGLREFAMLTFEGWCLDQIHRQVCDPGGKKINLTTAEFDILRALCLHHGRVLSRRELLDLSYLHLGKPVERCIDVHIRNLRLKIEHDPRQPKLIKTIRLAGYVFTAWVDFGRKQ